MTKVERVFVGLDFSAGSDEALRQAHARALSFGAKLGVCHILPNELRNNLLFPHVTKMAAFQIPADLEKLTEAAAKRILAITGRGPDDFDLIVDDGAPYAALLMHAEKWRADFVVVGSHGMTAANVLLGSVTRQIIRYAHCPVLIARASEGGGGVFAGTDFSDASMPALQAAAEEARRTGAELTVVHSLDVAWSAAAYPAMAFGGTPVSLSAEQMMELDKAADEQLAAALKQLGATGRTRVTRGSAGLGLIEITSQLKADLLVVGTTGRTGLKRVLLGSVAETVAEGASCSVLIVRLDPA
jgi:nucleotide-binding universal stress UspA family protein